MIFAEKAERFRVDLAPGDTTVPLSFFCGTYDEARSWVDDMPRYVGWRIIDLHTGQQLVSLIRG